MDIGNKSGANRSLAVPRDGPRERAHFCDLWFVDEIRFTHGRKFSRCPYKEHWDHPQYLMVSEVHLGLYHEAITDLSQPGALNKWSASPQFPNQPGINQQ